MITLDHQIHVHWFFKVLIVYVPQKMFFILEAVEMFQSLKVYSCNLLCCLYQVGGLKTN